MKAFVTGGTGYVGKRVVQRLIERGYDVTCLVRHPKKAVDLCELGATILQGDITVRETMRQGMGGADVVFHVDAWREVGLPPGASERLERINIGGTENVLDLAVELDVPKIVYTSTTTVLGDTRRTVVDKTYRGDISSASIYDRTKYQAHQVAERYIAQDAPVIIVMPGEVYGPAGHSVVGALVRLLLRRMVPIVPGADTGFTFVHVDDVARGHVLAAEKGRIGASYILAGDVMTVGDALQVIARLAGVPAPLLLLDSRLFVPFRSLVNRIERSVSLSPMISSERLHSMGCTSWVTSAKAERELGYTHRSVEEGMAETVLWEVTQLQGQPAVVQNKGLLTLIAATLTLGVILLWRRRAHR